MKRFWAILIMLYSTSLIGQRSYYFVEVESQDSAKYKLIFGDYEYNPTEIEFTKSLTKDITNPEIFAQKIESKLSTLDDNERKIFIYIHGMWGHQGWYQEGVLSTFENKVFPEDNGPSIVLSLIWHSGIQYFDNVRHALNVGEFFAPIIDEIFSIPDTEIDMLCHSMGNRVFQGIQSQLKTKTGSQPSIKDLYMVAADLEEDIFNSSQPLEDISNLASNVSIYVHNNDRSLGISKSLNENKRLGLNADKKVCLQDSCLAIVDVSIIQDNEGIGPSLSNHRYFYTSPTVRNDLKLSLSNLPNPDRKVIDHPRRLQLLPLKEK
jgi:hypothetical protein